jgi:hypothetical protein
MWKAMIAGIYKSFKTWFSNTVKGAKSIPDEKEFKKKLEDIEEQDKIKNRSLPISDRKLPRIEYCAAVKINGAATSSQKR